MIFLVTKEISDDLRVVVFLLILQVLNHFSSSQVMRRFAEASTLFWCLFSTPVSSANVAMIMFSNIGMSAVKIVYSNNLRARY